MTRLVPLLSLLLLGAGPSPAPERPVPSPPPAARSPYLPSGLPDGWYATIETSLGVALAHLFPEQAPQAVAYFAAFAEGKMEWHDTVTGEIRKQPYYDGLLVHKIKPFERLELGDPTGTGRGAPLIYVPFEQGPKGFGAPYRIGMTRSSLGRISAAMIFVTDAALPYFNNQHPCIGEIVAGQSIIDRICSIPVDGDDVPQRPIRVDRIRIHKVGDPPPLAEPVPYVPKPVEFEAKPGS